MRLLTLFALTAALAAAQVTTPTVITERMRQGRQIIDEAIEALGGDNFLALRSKVEQGRVYSFYRRQVSGLAKSTIYSRYLTAPTTPKPEDFYLRERQAFGEDERWSVIFNEVDGYEVTFRGVRPLRQDTIDEFRERRRKDIFYILLRRIKEPDMIFEYVGREVIDNKPLEIVEIIDGNNEAVRVYFHYRTKLPMRQMYEWRDKDRIRHEITTIFDNFKDVGGGVKLPWIVQRERDGDRVFSLFAKSVEINQSLSDDQIGVPADMKMLERQQ